LNAPDRVQLVVQPLAPVVADAEGVAQLLAAVAE
jgi:hypothetical protein